MSGRSKLLRSTVFADAFSRHLDLLAEHAGSARKGSAASAIHKVRVAGRRLRSTLDLFADCLPAKKRRRWRQAFKRLGQKSGAARDLDVQIDFITALLKGPARGKADMRPGLERLLLRLEQERHAVQPEVAAAVDRLVHDDTLASCQQWLNKFKRHPSKIGLKQARRMALGFLLCQYIRVLSHDHTARKPENPAALHEMRIAAKHFRYALEILEPLFDAGFSEQIALAKSWQAQLGEIHDCDVWLERLPHFLGHERARFEAFFGHTEGFAEIVPGITQLETDRRHVRQEHFHAFHAAWKQEKNAPCWRVLLAH